MQDTDFFADLLPVKREAQPKASPFGQDDMLASLEAQSTANSVDLLGGEELSKPSPSRSINYNHKETLVQPVFHAGKATPDLAEIEQATQVVIERTMKQFAGGLQRILEDVNKRLEYLENQSESLGKSLAEAREAADVREEGLRERFGSLEKTLRSIHRGVQVVRDKQELAEARADLAKLAVTEEPKQTVKEAIVAPLTSAPSVASTATISAARATATALQAEPSVPQLPQIQTTPPQIQTAPPLPPAPAPTPTPPSPAAQPQPQINPPQQPQPQFAPPAPQYSAPMPPPQARTSVLSQPMQPPPVVPQAQSYQAPEASQYSAQPAPQPQAPPQPQYSGPPTPQSQYSGQMPAQAPPPKQPFYMPMGAPEGLYAPPQQEHKPEPAPFAPPPPQPPAPPPPPAPLSFSSYQPSPPSGPMGYPTLPNAPPHPPGSQGFGPGPQGAPLSSASFPPYRQQPPPFSRGPGRGPPPGPPPSGQESRSVPLEQVIDDVANMGFSRHEVRSVVNELMDKGQSVDLNVVLDRLMNGPRR